MTTLQEGDVEFEFHEGCQASHYDRWAFFRNQFSHLTGTKAVDFLCINHCYTWLIEVKDYRHHPRTKPSELHEEVATKVRDTLAGLAAARANAVDPAERKMARKALTKRWRVALHLEQPGRPSKLRPKIIDPANLKMKLRQVVRPIDPHPEVNAVAGRVPWDCSATRSPDVGRTIRSTVSSELQ